LIKEYLIRDLLEVKLQPDLEKKFNSTYSIIEHLESENAVRTNFCRLVNEALKEGYQNSNGDLLFGDFLSKIAEDNIDWSPVNTLKIMDGIKTRIIEPNYE